jgi:hypothetical protein
MTATILHFGRIISMANNTNNQRNGNRDDDNDTKKGGGTGKSGSHQGSKSGTGTTRAGEEKRGSKDR